MTEEMISQNIVLGSKHPGDKREKNDLGRFGFGLKTASLSMARELHVFSRAQDQDLCYRSWNLDILEETQKWYILTELPEWYEELPDSIKVRDKGTLIVWRNCDRLKKNASNLASFQALGTDLTIYLGTIFCRYIQTPLNLDIFVNEEKVKAWDPIPPGSKQLNDGYIDKIHNMEVKPYILPHQSDFKDLDEYKEAGRINGWNAQQGFYVYRNKRLIVNGG